MSLSVDDLADKVAKASLASVSTAGNGQVTSSLPVASDQESLIHALPSETLIRIFRDLDVVSQKRAERVCTVWRGLLRDTVSLQEHRRVDLAYLANIHPDSPEESLVGRAIRTFDMAIAGYPDAIAELRLTAETSADRHLAYDAASYEVVRDKLFRANQVVFEGIAMQARLFYMLLCDGAAGEMSRTVEFRNVTITHLSWTDLTPVSVIEGVHMNRRVSCTLLCGRHHPDALVEFVTALGRHDAEMRESRPLLRLAREHLQLVAEPVEGVILAGPVTEDNFFEWEVLIEGPEETCYEGFIYPARIVYPRDYPFNAPAMRFACQMYHPNIYPDGGDASQFSTTAPAIRCAAGGVTGLRP